MKTRITELLGIKYPIICGGMMWLCRAELCAAISNAGGMGNITSSNYPTTEELRGAIKLAKSLTRNPFSVNLTLSPSFRITDEMLKSWFYLCVEEKVPALEIGGTMLDKFLGAGAIKEAHDAGIKLIHKVGAVRHAKRAEDVGYDAVMTIGFEAGGHPLNDDVTSMVLASSATATLKIPVIMGGGIADGRGLATALVLGAEGVMMATRFVATTECVAHENAKNELVRRKENDTRIWGKSIGLQGRALNNKTVEQVLSMEEKHAKLEELQPILSGLRQQKIWNEGDVDAGVFYSGQSVGLIHNIVSCKELMETMVKDAEKALSVASNKVKA